MSHESLDLLHAPYTRLYLHEPFPLRTLPVLTKALAAYLRILVEPDHGWLWIRDLEVRKAIRNAAGGDMSRGDQRIVARAVGELVTIGHLARCRIFDGDLGTFTTRAGRDVPLSSWMEEPEGEWLVIVDYVPTEHGLSREDTGAWHAMRLERAMAMSERACATVIAPQPASKDPSC